MRGCKSSFTKSLNNGHERPSYSVVYNSNVIVHFGNVQCIFSRVQQEVKSYTSHSRLWSKVMTSHSPCTSRLHKSLRKVVCMKDGACKQNTVVLLVCVTDWRYCKKCFNNVLCANGTSRFNRISDKAQCFAYFESLESLGESHCAQVHEGHAVDVAELKWRHACECVQNLETHTLMMVFARCFNKQE